MHALHDDMARILAAQVKARGVVVWYDARSEFVPFVDELRGSAAAGAVPATVLLGGVEATLVQYDGSMFQLRAVIERLMGGEAPPRLVVYLPGVAKDAGSVLMEAQLAGSSWEPQLRKVARDTLRKRYTDGVIDELLRADTVTYQDLVTALDDDGTRGPSLLKALFPGIQGTDAILAEWLVHDQRDQAIEAKAAVPELLKLIRSRLGLDLQADSNLIKARASTLRYVLGGEFRLDLLVEAPPNLSGVPTPATKAHEGAIRDLAQRLRTSHRAEYPLMADRVEAELALSSASLPPDSLGAIDTFRFEERVVLAHCGDLIVAKRFDDALAFVAQREHNFWLDQDVSRRAQWEACRLMAELGRTAAAVMTEVKAMPSDAQAWVARYTADDGWMRLDLAQRRLETWVATLDDDAHERGLMVVRQAYEDACQLMATGFTTALEKAHWSVADTIHQTQVYSEVVSAQPQPVAYFLVDAMRYEMGAELAARLPLAAELRLRPAIAALPTITPVGMAALQPGASASFAVVAEGSKLGSRIDGTFLPDLTARRKFAESRVPEVVDLTLGDVVTAPKSKVAGWVADKRVVIVRSQEIDLAGESHLGINARQVMDSVIDQVARAIRRLADAGVTHAVVSADHGHIFVHDERDEDMRVESPGGQTIDPHRRCWIGRGGATPPGCVRVTAAELGYASDLEFVFPRGAGVFRAGGDLGFHHGGPSLQELVVPVLTVRSQATATAVPKKSPIEVSNLPYEVTNRIFSVRVLLQGQLAMFSEPAPVLPMLLSTVGQQVGRVGMATGAEHDATTGTVTLSPGQPAEIAFLLTDDTAKSVRVVIRDPVTDAELYGSPDDIPVKLAIG